MFFGFELFAHCVPKDDMWVRFFAGQATPFEVRCCSVLFTLMPVMLVVFYQFGPDWFPLLVTGLLFAAYCWVEVIPAKITWVIGAILWLLVLWLALTGRY